MGGCFGGVHSRRGPPRLGRFLFFCFLFLNNYFKIFQKRKMFSLLLGGYPCGVTPWGGPPRPMGPPERSPSVTEFWKKLQKFSKNILKLDMHQNTPNHNSNIHFRPPGLLRGALGGSKWFFGQSRGLFGSESADFFSKCLVLTH